MATVKFTPKGQKKAAPVTKAKVGATIPGLNIQDNGDDTFTVLGEDAAGQGDIDISGVATMTTASDAPAVVTVDAPVPPATTSSAVHAAVPAPKVGATANVTLVVTFTSGTPAPITVVWPQDIIAGPVSGVAVKPGTPTTH